MAKSKVAKQKNYIWDKGGGGFQRMNTSGVAKQFASERKKLGDVGFAKYADKTVNYMRSSRGSNLPDYNMMPSSKAFQTNSLLSSYKKGGKVKNTGPAFLHKGERVLNTKQTKKYDKQKAMRTKLNKAAGKAMFGY